MLNTKSQSEYYKGSAPSVSPTNQQPGVFSFCSGGVPRNGSFARIPGKSIQVSGVTEGGAFSINQFSNLIVVQRYTGLVIYNIKELVPLPQDYVYDNEGNLVYDNEGIIVVQ